MSDAKTHLPAEERRQDAETPAPRAEVTVESPVPVPNTVHSAEPLTTRSGEQRDLTCRSLDLHIRAESVNEQERSVEAVLATDAPVTVFDFRTFEMIEERLLMDGVDIPGQMPLLNNHLRFDLEFMLGSIRNIRVDGGVLVGRLHFAEGPADSPEERAWQKVRQGHLTDVSVGYRSINYVDIPPGKTQSVNGRSFTAGDRTLRVTTQWQPREGSVTPIGADQAAKIRADHGLPVRVAAGDTPSHSPRKDSTMPQQLRQYLESIGLRSDASDKDAWAFYRNLQGDQQARAEQLRGDVAVPPEEGAGTRSQGAGESDPPAPTDGQRSATTNPPPAGSNPPEPDGQRTVGGDGQRATDPPPRPADPAQIAQDAVRQERERVNAIRQAAPEWMGDDVVQRCIDEGLTVERAEREFLAEIRAGRQAPIEGAPFGHVSRRLEGDAAQRALAAGLMHATGTPVFENSRGAEFRANDSDVGRNRMTEQDADQGDRYRSWSLVDLAREACRLELRTVPHDTDEMIRAAVSTTALQNVFTTSIHARLLMSYLEAADTSDWCSVEDVANFQTQDRVALGKTGTLKKLARGATAEHATIDDSVESYKIARYAEQFVVDEQDIVDNNLDSFQRLPREMGMAAANLRPDLVYAILLANAALGADSTALFHSDHSNTDTNTLSLANIAAGRTKMMQQTQGGKRLNIRPRYLLVPGDLEDDARNFIESTQIVIASGEDATTIRGAKNTIASLGLQLRVEGRIDAAGVTDPDSGTAYTGSATNWFLFSNPGRTVVVGYRAGTGRRPRVRRFALDKGQWGIGWDINLDIGAKALDFRGCYRGNT